ncbi:MAG: PspC domain-containing protein [Aeromicrobium sp.]
MTEEFRRAHRPADRRVLGGVAAGLADHLGVPVVWVRVGFVVATWLNGAGVIAYLLLWRFLPLVDPERAPGLESAERRGLRIAGTRMGGREIAQTVGIVALGAGVLVLMQLSGRGISDAVMLPLAAAVVGVVVIWRQIDDATLSQWVRQSGGLGYGVRLLAGVGLIAVAAIYFVTQERGWGALVDLGAATVIALIGAGLILGPWIGSLIGDLAKERRERVRSQERADVAAHLHDSVLQTLALLQKNADDPAMVATLARRQERDLRSWMYGHDQPAANSLLASLRAAADEVEDAHHVVVEVVAVGDAPVTPDVAALASAAREAIVNAAKHAQVDRVDVYMESNGQRVDVFVRDRGIGFDPDAVAEDRFGIRGSIVGRVERHGGTAEIRSVVGEGTEVRLGLPVVVSIEEVDA